jgi:predicted PurR-regulated permease PerM
MSTAGPGESSSPDSPDHVRVRHRRLRDAAAHRNIPLATILVTVAVVALTYLAGKLAYRIRDVLLMIAVAGFTCLILNPLVVALQRWGIRRRGLAVAVVS